MCHSCGKDFCEACLDEGKEYYYCKNPECHELLKKDFPSGRLSEKIICPNCASELTLSEDERINSKVHCPACEAVIDFTVIPTEIVNKANYVELFSSLNQGDIALIKSLLANATIDYYTSGENFLSVDPLIQPAKFYVLESEADDAKEVLKDFELHIRGTSKEQDG